MFEGQKLESSTGAYNISGTTNSYDDVERTMKIKI